MIFFFSTSKVQMTYILHMSISNMNALNYTFYGRFRK